MGSVDPRIGFLLLHGPALGRVHGLERRRHGTLCETQVFILCQGHDIALESSLRFDKLLLLSTRRRWAEVHVFGFRHVFAENGDHAIVIVRRSRSGGRHDYAWATQRRTAPKRSSQNSYGTLYIYTYINIIICLFECYTMNKY